MQTNRYARGKIYAIKSYLTEEVYIGSTCEITLSRRMAQHRSILKRFLRLGVNPITSRHILQHGDAYIELLENFPCNTKDELHKREGYHIRNSNCVNKYIPGRTPLEYRTDNVELIKQNNKQYRNENAESIKQYRIDNAELLKTHYIKRVYCSYCCNTFAWGAKNKHIKAAKHIKNYKKSYLECFGEPHVGVLDSEDY